MLSVPEHLPVLSVCPPGTDVEVELFEKLLARLRAEAIEVSRTEAGGPPPSSSALLRLLTSCDMVLLDVAAGSDLPQLRFSVAQPDDRHDAAENTFICHSSDDIPSCSARILNWLERCRMTTPLAGAVLIGGRSSRMGRPKHLITHDNGETWLERSLRMLRTFVDQLVISGGGELPEALRSTERVDDLDGVQGPLAGIGALVKRYPYSSWVVLACDMPAIDERALNWLLDQRDGRRRAVIPRNPVTGKSEPLLAWYDYRCGPLIEELISSGGRRISELGIYEQIAQPLIPDELVDSWRNVNYPEDLGSKGPSGP